MPATFPKDIADSFYKKYISTVVKCKIWSAIGGKYMRRTTCVIQALLVIASPALASLDDMPVKPNPKPKTQLPSVSVMPSPKLSETTTVEPTPACEYRGLTATLALDRSHYRSGDDIYPTVTIKCTWEYQRLFNPFFNQLTEVPGRLRVFDESGKFVTQYLDFVAGSFRAPSETDCVEVYGGGFVGSQLHLRLPEKTMSGQPLQPGTYRMQVVMFNTLLFSPAEYMSDRKGPKVIAASPLVPFLVSSREAAK